MMETFFLCILIGIIILTCLMLIFLFMGTSIYDKLIGILVLSTKVILILILIGFVDAVICMWTLRFRMGFWVLSVL